MASTAGGSSFGDTVVKVEENMKKIASNAATAFHRAKQFTEEKIGSAEKTEYDASFEHLLAPGDRIKHWTEKLVKLTEANFQPNPNARVEDFVTGKLEKLNVVDIKSYQPGERVTTMEILGQQMVNMSQDYGRDNTYGRTLQKVGESQKQLGLCERAFVSTASLIFLEPLKSFLDNDILTITKEKKILEMKRLDLDVCKNKQRKATAPQSIHAAEADLRLVQTEFDRQVEITGLLLEGAISSEASHVKHLKEYVQCQHKMYTQCAQQMSELSSELGL